MSTENELEKEMEEGELPEEGEITDDEEPKQTTGKDKPEREAEMRSKGAKEGNCEKGGGDSFERKCTEKLTFFPMINKAQNGQILVAICIAQAKRA